MDSELQSDTPENPVIVFDECPWELDGRELAIVLRYRQPSFTYLGVRPTPKGFKSLSDFHQHRVQVTAALSLGAIPRFATTANDRSYRCWPPP
jgi:hypothetical protein